MDALLPKSIQEKRRRKKEASISESANGSDDVVAQRGRNTFSRRTTESDHHDAHDDAEHSTDSDLDSSSSRPTVHSTHPSQIGYLTTNSPLVQATHHFEAQEASSQPRVPNPAIPDFLQNDPRADPTASGLAPPQTLAKRSTSVGRLRDVFRSKKSISSTDSAEPSPERRPDTAVDKSSRSSSVAQQPAPAVPTVPKSEPEPPQLQEEAARKASTSVRGRRFSRSQKLELKPPRTPPSNENSAPIIVNTPPTPTDATHSRSSGHIGPGQTDGAQDDNNANASPPSNVANSRRRRAGSDTLSLGPSKLSNIVSAPLTPPLEASGQQGPPTPGNSTSNFFSSMFSAVQNTASSLTNTISSTNLSPGKNRSQPQLEQPQVEPEANNVEVESSQEANTEEFMEAKEPAVKTLGMGDLSLSQLGIVETSSNAPTPVTAKFDVAEARSRSESAPVDSNNHTITELPTDESIRPKSLYDTHGDRTPPAQSLYEGATGGKELQRVGSIRSAIGRRRKRGSSAATGGAIGAAIAAANASVARPNASAITPKSTGFAVATKKRNRDFHNLFKSVPDDDYLIEDYSCALQREILAHGRLYVSEGHLCFNSNIIGWVTTLVMSFDEIVSVEKRSTALIFKNGLEISTLHAKHIFASFASRDTTYDLIVKIWKLSHPNIKSSLNGVTLDETGGDRTEKVETESISVGGSQSLSGSEVDSEEDDDDVYDEDEDNDDNINVTQTAEPAVLEAPAEKAVARKPSGAVVTNGVSEKQTDAAAPSQAADFPGPATHAPTDCGDAATHYDKVIGDDVVPAPLGKVYSLLFGAQSPTFMGKWLTTDQKCTELQMEDKKGLSEEARSRTFSYIKPLPGSIGPRQTKCIIVEQLENYDLERAVNVLVSTQTPDVPSGNVFSVKTKYCLSWAENNSTRIQANCTVEWTGKSWLKGPIESGANTGQVQYCKELFASVKTAISRAKAGALPNGAAAHPTKAGKKRGRKGKSAAASSSPTSDGEGIGGAKGPAKQDWGLLEPVRPFLGPIVDTIRPLLTGNVVYGLLVGLLVAAWFGFGINFSNRSSRAITGAPGSGAANSYAMGNYAQRRAAYEEMWLREESELWNWIEERVGLERLGREAASSPAAGAAARGKGDLRDFPRVAKEKIGDEKMDERELREAIKVTEERLKVLKKIVHRGEGEL